MEFERQVAEALHQLMVEFDHALAPDRQPMELVKTVLGQLGRLVDHSISGRTLEGGYSPEAWLQMQCNELEIATKIAVAERAQLIEFLRLRIMMVIETARREQHQQWQRHVLAALRGDQL